jgi:trans-aconitate methyltransferase
MADAVAAEAGAVQAAAPGAGAVPAGRLEFRLADIRTWQPERPVDVITCNAVLQWIPGHQNLLTSWVRWLTPGGWLAFQLPGNFDQPSHTILRDLASAPRWKPLLGGATLNRQAGEPGGYLALLAGAGCEVDAWETTYLHVLQGQDAVVDWYRGSGLRPVLAALPPALAEDFLAEYRDRIRVAYRRRRMARCYRSGACSWSPGPGPDARKVCRPDQDRARLTTSLEIRGSVSSCDNPFQARLMRWAATSSIFGLRASSHHCPVMATMPTSICAYIGTRFGS